MAGSRAAPSRVGPPAIEHDETARATARRARAIGRPPSARAVSVRMTEDARGEGARRLELPLDGDGEHLEQAAHEAPLPPFVVRHAAGQCQVLDEDLVE